MNEWIPWLQDLIGLGAAGGVEFVTDWAGPLGWWIVLQLAFLLGGIRAGLQITVHAGIAMVTNTWLKWLIAEPRPFISDESIHAFRATQGFGMPSGHAQGAAAVWGGLAWLVRGRRWLVTIMIVLLVITGLSRVYLGVHSPMQVFVGWLVGLALLAATLALWPKLEAHIAPRSEAWHWGALVVVTATVLGITELVLLREAGFTLPPEWLANHAAIAGVDSVDPVELGLWGNILPVLMALVAGYVIVAIQMHHRNLALNGARQKGIAVALAILLNFVFIALLARLDSRAMLPLVALAQPLICVLAPTWLIARKAP